MLFNFQEHELTKILDEDNNVWFKVKDVANILGYKNTHETIEDNVREKHRSVLVSLGIADSYKLSNAQPHAVFINQSGLYSLIMRSTKDEAKKLGKVVHSIRRTGQYKLVESNDKHEVLQLVALLQQQQTFKYKQLTLLENQLTTRDRQLEQQTNAICRMSETLVAREGVLKSINQKVVPDTVYTTKQHRFILLQKNLEPKDTQTDSVLEPKDETDQCDQHDQSRPKRFRDSDYRYWASRVQLQRVKVKVKYPRSVLRNINDPYAVNLLNRLKEQEPANVKRYKNHLNTDMSPEDLIVTIIKL